MTPEFKRACEKTLRIEGGFVDNPNDRGGPTNLGVTLKTLNRWFLRIHKRNADINDLKSITVSQAETLYFDLYWRDKHLPCQAIAEWWEPMGEEVFDTAVHSGPERSAIFLQRTLNLLNRNEKVFDDLKVDAWAGSVTYDAMQAMDKLPRGRERLLLGINVEQGAFLRDLALRDPRQEEFYGGWLLHRVQLGQD